MVRIRVSSNFRIEVLHHNYVCLDGYLSDFHIGHDQMYEINRSSRETNPKIREINLKIRETNLKRSYVFLPTEILRIIIDNVMNIDIIILVVPKFSEPVLRMVQL